MKKSKDKYNKLTPEEQDVIQNKATEPPFSGKYNDFYKDGMYVCKRCDNPLFNSEAKFKSGCGWPSFDDHIEGSVKSQKDRDGLRTEILCANCWAHLGHVFKGEHYTDKNTRNCVNSLSIKFIPKRND
jgi:methionine-R-sulfoxide reductase